MNKYNTMKEDNVKMEKDVGGKHRINSSGREEKRIRKI